MSSPLLEYYRPLPEEPPRPASAQGSHREKPSPGRPRPQSVPPGGTKVRSLRGEVARSRAVYSLDDRDEPDPPPAGRDPTLDEKPDEEERKEPRWVTTRNRSGVVRTRLSKSYAVHVAGRLAGRDRDAGFRSPFGADYVPVGGEVSAMSGENIRKQIGGGWESSMRAHVTARLPPKVALHLEHAADFKVSSYKFNYFQLDLSDRPLEIAPKKSLSITFTILAGSGEAYAAMESEHPYPTDAAHTWKFEIEAPKAGANDSHGPHKQSATITITPSDPPYAVAGRKVVVIAVRSELGFLEYRFKAVTHTFLTGSGIAAMLENRGAKKVEEKKRERERQLVKESIKHSYYRCKRAMVGKDPPPEKERHLFSPASSVSPTAQSPVAVAPDDETNNRKKKSFASSLGATLANIEANPGDPGGGEKSNISQAKGGETKVVQAGGTTQRAGGTTTARSLGSQSARSKSSMYSARSFSAMSMASSARSSRAGARSSRGAPVIADEDMIALDKGQWTKIVLKARVPAAMRLEWALQELEVARGKRSGETAARRYIKSIPRDVRKRDQEQNMSSVLVNSITGLGSGPILTRDALQQTYGDSYRAGEYYIESQKSGQDIPNDQVRVPSLKLEVLDDDSGVASTGAAASRGDDRLASAREHKPESATEKSGGQNSHRGETGGANRGNSGGGSSARDSGGMGSSRGKDGGKLGPSSARKAGGGLSARGDGSLSARSSMSEDEAMQSALFSDEEKLAQVLYKSNEEQYVTKYSKTQHFLDTLDEGQPAVEVGVSLPAMVQMLLGMKIISTSKSSAIGKRDVMSIGRELFHERALDHHPSDEEIILTFEEFKVMLDRISGLLGKPYYADRPRPKKVDKQLWQRLKEDINPANRLMRMSKQENFRRRILKAFGKYNKKSDGKLMKDEYVELCERELGLTRPQSLGLLQPAGINPFFKTLDLQSFATIFIAPEEPVVDVRDSDESRDRLLDVHHIIQNVKHSISSQSIDELHKKDQEIDKYQMDARQASQFESKEIVKTGWLYRQETAGAAKLWRMYFALLESHVGGSVIRLFTSPVTRLYQTRAALEAAGQVDEMWVDTSEPADIVTLADAEVVRELAMHDASARGVDHTDDLGNDDGTWEQCIIQVRCRDLTDLSIKKIVNLKLRGSLVDDEAQDWIDAIRQAGQKRELWSGDTLKEIRPIAKASEELRTACTPDVKNEDVDFLVQDVTTILLEALRPSSIIQPSFDKEGVINLAKSKQEDKEEDDGKKGKKRKFKIMETITEETLSALRAFLTERGDDADL